MTSLREMERFLREAGAKRVGEDAKRALQEAIDEYAAQIAKRAVELAAHADRNTVMASDVKLAKR